MSVKPVIYIANVDETDIKTGSNELVEKVREYADNEGSEIVTISAKIEADIAGLDEVEAELFLEELGLEESGLDRVIKAGYRLLNLISFLQ